MAPKKQDSKKESPKPVQTNAGPNPMGSSKPSTTSQVLKAAGVGGISKQEFKSIADTTGKSSGQLIQRLDKINEKLEDKGKAKIDLNSGAANMLIRQAGPVYGTTFLGMEPAFGTGTIGTVLEGMRGTRDTGGYQNPNSGYGEVTQGKEPTRMMGGTAIRPSGNQVVQGFGKQYEMPKSLTTAFTPTTPGTGPGPLAPSTTNAGGDNVTNGATDNVTENTTTTGGVETTTPTTDTGMDFFSSVLANWAPGFRRAQRKKGMGIGSTRTKADRRKGPLGPQLNQG